MKVLALDTSSAIASIAVAENNCLLTSRTFDAPRGRGAEVFTILEEIRPLWDGLNLMAIGIGPGAYNGLRVACSLAISFQLALDIPIVTTPSITFLDTAESHYHVVGDARGGRIFCSEIHHHSLQSEIHLFDFAEFNAFANSAALPIFRIGTIPNHNDLPLASPSASTLALLAPTLRPTPPEAIAPIYLKPPHITQPRTSPPSP